MSEQNPTPLKAPFPWFGGKSRAASLIWERFGDVANYIEPFAGSLAVLLSRPTPPRIETVNDLDCYLANFWRATSQDAEAVAQHCDWPVNEIDLHARHKWLREQSDFRERMRSDPDYYDAKIAGWWVWGLSQWIGSGWCEVEGKQWSRVRLDGVAGVHGGSRQKPRVSGHDPGTGIHRSGDLSSYFHQLKDRLRRVRVACGDWSRILKPAVLDAGSGVTAVLLDPPYAQGDYSYANGADRSLSSQVGQWALDHGNDPCLRIALCGYEGEHEIPPEWECVEWKATGGYSNKRSKSEGEGLSANRYKERIWFSPHCLKAKQPDLFTASPSLLEAL